jgi:hypothetical protein
MESLLLHFSCQTNVLHAESLPFYKASFFHRSFELEFPLKDMLADNGTYSAHKPETLTNEPEINSQ